MPGKSSEIRAGKAFVEIGGKDKLSPLLEKIGKKMKAFGTAMRDVGVKVGAIGGAGLAALGVSVHEFVDQAHDLDLMSKRTGIAVEALSELIALMSPEKVEAFEMGLKHMQKTITEASQGSKEANQTLQRLGITLGDLQGLTPDQQFGVFADAMARISDPTTRAGIALQIFGKSGTAMLPMLMQGSAGMAEMRAEAQRLGLTIGKDATKSAGELHHAWRDLTAVSKNLSFWIGSAVAPMVTELVKIQVRATMAVRDWIKAHPVLIQQFATISAKVFAAGAALAFLGTGFIFAGKAIGVVAPILGTVLKLLNLKTLASAGATGFKTIAAAALSLLNPITLIGAALVAGAGLWLYYSGNGAKAIAWLKPRFGELWATVSETIGGISDALSAGDLALAAKVGWAGVKAVWAEIKGFAAEIWQGAWAAIASIWVNGTSWLEGIWAKFSTWMYDNAPTLTGFIATLFENLWTDLRKLQNDWVTGLGKDMLRITRDFQNADPAARKAALDAIDREHDANEGNINIQHAANLGEIAKKQQQTPAERDADLKKRLDEIEAARKAALKGITDDKDAAIANAKADAAKAQAELDALRKKAADAAHAANVPGHDEGGPDLAGIGETISKSLSSIGQFGGLNIGALSGGDGLVTAANATKTSAKNIEKYTKKIADATDNGLAFA